VPWPAFDGDGVRTMSLIPPRPRLELDFATTTPRPVLDR
jgi:hypothetical protein